MELYNAERERYRTLPRRPVALAFLAAFLPIGCLAAALHDAIRDGDLPAVVRLLREGANVEQRDAQGITPLIAAALAGHRTIASRLIEAGADPAGRDRNGFTALHAAAHTGHLEIVELLLAEGVDIDDQRNTSRLTPLHASAERDHRAIVRALLDAGADTERTLENGHTPIFRAVLKAHPRTVEILREHGADCSVIHHPDFRRYCLTAGGSTERAPA